MFELLLLLTAVIAITGIVIAYDGSRDVFHPLVIIGPMLLFLYAWMPWELLRHHGLARFFDGDQLRFVQLLNMLGVLAFVLAVLATGVRIPPSQRRPLEITSRIQRRLLIGSAALGSIGLLCWSITIINVGGFTAAFSTSYAGGQDSSGYIRDGAMLLLIGVLLAVVSLSAGGPRLLGILLALVFGAPWASSALLMGRRGPTFNLAVVCLMGWYINRRKRPPLLLVTAGGLLLGWFVLFLVTNRQQIYLGSSFDVNTNVSNQVEKPDTGNEYIYGSGSVLAAQRRDHYFWMRRYLAQVLIRPIPSAIWPTKYEDFGVPELLYNAGTGQGIGDTLGWVGAPGSAPGIIADFWLEVWWFAPVLMGLVGYGFATTWRRAVTRGGPWSTLYVCLVALSIYLVMQTGEAVIFRTLELAIPAWLAWKWAIREPRTHARRRLFGAAQPALARVPDAHQTSLNQWRSPHV